MASSGTYAFAPPVSDLILDSFERAGVHPTSLTRDRMISARRSLNMELQSWSVRPGPNLWEIDLQTITLVAGTATYALATETMTVLDVYFSTINGGGTGIDIDRLMLPISRSQYEMIPNKAQVGFPTVYWFQRLITPQITIWQPPQTGAPSYLIKYTRMKRIQDAAPNGLQTPDIPYRALDALCDGLALRLAKKFAPAETRADIVAGLKQDAAESWGLFSRNDTEDGLFEIQPQLNSYWRM